MTEKIIAALEKGSGAAPVEVVVDADARSRKVLRAGGQVPCAKTGRI